MKKILKWSGIGLLAIVGSLALLVTYIYFDIFYQPKPAKETVSINADSIQIAHKNSIYSYAKCTVYQVDKSTFFRSWKSVYVVPGSLGSACVEKPGVLTSDGEYLYLNACRARFAAGGCTDKYRSSNASNWQTYQGITWKDHKKIEVWR